MKTKIALLLLILGLQSCHKTEPDPQVPAIKSISFEGVPPQNVDFDRARSTITILLPTDLRGGVKPILELTDGARVVSGLTTDGFVDLTPLCYCRDYKGLPATLIVGDTSSISTQRNRKGYLIKIANQGPLKALNSDIPLTFSQKTKELILRLPVENLYTNPTITQVSFTHLATGIKRFAGFDEVCLNTCDSRFTNQLIFRLTTPIEHTLTPGTYTVSIGNIVFPQKLVVTE